MEKNHWIVVKCVEYANFLFPSDSQLKKARGDFFVVRKGEFMAEYFKQINGSQYFRDSERIKRADKFFYARVKKFNIHEKTDFFTDSNWLSHRPLAEWFRQSLNNYSRSR